MGQEFPREIADLQAVQAFYRTVLESHLGHSVPQPEAVTVSSGTAGQAEALRNWLDLLDMAITPPMLREALKHAGGLEQAHPLLRYFVAKASSRAGDRDKADCVITYLFRTPPAGTANSWQRSDTDITYYHLSQAALAFEAELYRALGDVTMESMAEAQVQLLREFEYFHQELEEFRHFDQITDSGIVQRVRELKHSLGKSFYHPDSLAMMAAWNDVFGRKFDELFHDAARQIKTFAENVKRDGGSIMSRVEGDITVKQLTEIETQQILADEYRNAQDRFRKVSQFKKAVDHKKSGRSSYPPAPARPLPAPAPGPISLGTPPSAPPPQPAASVPPSAPSRSQARAEAEVLAVPPSPAVQNAVQEGKLHSTRETIKQYVRGADAKMAALVPVKHTRINLSPAEVDAFKADYPGEKSFRADYAGILMILVSYQVRMLIEVDEYNQKCGSAYLWKPHADALGYLLSTFERVALEAEQIKTLALQRGLQEKANALGATVERIRKYAQTVSQTLQAADQSFIG